MIYFKIAILGLPSKSKLIYVSLYHFFTQKNISKMKKYIIIPVILLTTAILAFCLSSYDSVNTTREDTPDVLSMTKSVTPPNAVSFAGEKIELDRYDRREAFDREINSFTYWHSTTMLLIKRANRYFPIIEPILKRNGIPDDFKYMAVIESSLDQRVVSPAKAAGIWQIMPATGKQYGLEVTNEVDERYNIEKATQAACKYLLDAKKKYGDWASVALSYNAGQGRITKELEAQQAETGLDLWLVEETTRYFYRIAAAKQIFENPKKYGFVITADQLYKPLEYKKVTVKETVPDLAVLAADHGLTYAQLKDANVWLRDRKLTVADGKEYVLRIPEIKSLYYSKESPKVHNKRWISN